MNKVHESLVKVACKKGNYKLATWLALRGNRESCDMVYLDNAYAALRPYGVTRHQFAGYLSALQKDGKYKQCDEIFGMVVV